MREVRRSMGRDEPIIVNGMDLVAASVFTNGEINTQPLGLLCASGS